MEDDPRVIEVLNKSDRLSEDEHAVYRINDRSSSGAASSGRRRVLLSALTGEGCDRLFDALDALLGRGERRFEIDLDAADGAAQAWLQAHGEVLDEAYAEPAHVRMTVRLSDADLGRFVKAFGARAQVQDADVDADASIAASAV
ncbi:MAG: hypothetical protein AAGL49_10855, partial [Pseudomonadota bacterium]